MTRRGPEIQEEETIMDVKKNFMQAAGELFGDAKSPDSPAVTDTPVRRDVPSPAAAPIAGSARRDTSVLTSDLTIIGRIEARGNIELNGALEGDLVTQGDVRIFGKVTGNVSGQNVTLLSGTVHGDIMAAERVQVDAQSAVVGDISACDLTACGRLEGDLKLKNSVTFEGTALLLGNVETKLLAVQEGAQLCGNLQMTGAREDEASSSAEKSQEGSASPKTEAEKEKGR